MVKWLGSASSMNFRLFSRRRPTTPSTGQTIPTASTDADALHAAYEGLIETCWEPLWRYAYRTTGDRDEAEDLLSETLIEGFRSFPQFRGGANFQGWMYRIMTTTRIDMVRRAARRKTESLDAPFKDRDGEEQTSPRDIVDEASNPEKIVLEPLLSERLQCALDALPEEFRAVVILAEMEMMDYAEVSRVLDIPIGTVRSRLHRGRAMLRKLLADHVEN